jgi:hypothetical protein
MSTTDIEQKYQVLNKRYIELFTRTTTLVKEQNKIKRSETDLERTIHFLRAELSMKGIFRAVES